MARPIRVEFEGAVYHATARGNERKPIFRGDEDRSIFLQTLGEAVEEYGLRIHGYCLMPNHYHLLVETPRGNLSRAIGWLQTTYSIRFNRRYRRSGHLFQGRFKAHVVETDEYATTLLRYVHLNPVRPRDKGAIISVEKRPLLAVYPWSSHPAYTGRKTAPKWLCTDWLSYFAVDRDEAQRRYKRFIEDAFGEPVESPWKNLQFGIALGGDEVLNRVRDFLKGKRGHEEVRWSVRVEAETQLKRAAQELAQEQEARSWQVWVRVRLGGERRIDVAKSYGYKDGSAVTHILKRLEASAKPRSATSIQISRLRKTFAERISSFKS